MSARDQAAQLLDELSRALTTRSELELGNLAQDLKACVARLQSAEYKQTDFETRSVFDVQRRTREYLAYFRGWQKWATRWARVLRAVGLDDVTEVVDVLPGWAPKIELGLVHLGYTGHVRLLDVEPEASEQLIQFISTIAPGFTLEAWTTDLFAASGTSQLVVANHILDDLMFSRWAERKGEDVAALYEDELLLKRAWRDCIDEGDDELVPTLARALEGLTAPGGQLVVAHYPSNVERLLGASEVGETFMRLFSQLRTRLSESLEPRQLPEATFDRRLGREHVAVFLRAAP